MSTNEIHFELLEIFRDLETVIALPCQVDEGGIVTNHMAAVWVARDRMNETLGKAKVPE